MSKKSDDNDDDGNDGDNGDANANDDDDGDYDDGPDDGVDSDDGDGASPHIEKAIRQRPASVSPFTLTVFFSSSKSK